MSQADTELFRPVPASLGIGWWLVIGLIVLGTLLPVVLVGRALWGAATLKYELTPTHLAIRYGPQEISIPRSEISGVTILIPTQGWRLWGTSLPGLQEGRWSFAETGPIRLYSTSLRPLTVIETPEGKWGISPVDPEGFRQALRTGQTGVWEPVRTGAGKELWVWSLFELLIAGPVAGLLWYLFRLRRHLGYRLTADALEVTGGLRPVRIPYRSITDVTVAEPPGFPWRIWGVGMPGLLWGDFVWKGVASRLKLYSTGYRPLVLVRAGGIAYGLTPQEPERFVAALRQRLGS